MIITMYIKSWEFMEFVATLLPDSVTEAHGLCWHTIQVSLLFIECHSTDW